MKVITTNRLNRFWKNGILPIKNSLANKLNTSSVVNNLLTTAAGYALDARQGKALDDKITALNGKLTGGYTHLTSNKAGYINLPNGLKMVFGMYPASSMAYNSGSGTYVVTLSLTEYGFKDPVWGMVGVKYPSGLPQAHILDLTTANIKIGCSHNAGNIYVMWLVIG